MKSYLIRSVVCLLLCVLVGGLAAAQMGQRNVEAINRGASTASGQRAWKVS